MIKSRVNPDLENPEQAYYNSAFDRFRSWVGLNFQPDWHPHIQVKKKKTVMFICMYLGTSYLGQILDTLLSQFSEYLYTHTHTLTAMFTHNKFPMDPDTNIA